MAEDDLEALDARLVADMVEVGVVEEEATLGEAVAEEAPGGDARTARIPGAYARGFGMLGEAEGALFEQLQACPVVDDGGVFAAVAEIVAPM